MQDKVKRGGRAFQVRIEHCKVPQRLPVVSAQRGGGEDGCLCVDSRYSVHLSRIPQMIGAIIPFHETSWLCGKQNHSC